MSTTLGQYLRPVAKVRHRKSQFFVFSVKIWTHKSSVLTEVILSLFTAVRPHGEMGADADVHGSNYLA
jgi:hypothetical protein